MLQATLFFLVTLLISSVQSTSSSIPGGIGIGVYNCDISLNSTVYGCTKGNYQGGNRLMCRDSPKPIMSWADKPLRNANYTVTSSMTKYIPDTPFDVIFTVQNYEGKYRGILYFAVDSKGEKVGSPLNNEFFWRPWANMPSDPCYRSGMHVSAAHKPYITSAQIVAPPKGTGTITVKVLFKTGDANTGYFWLPAVDLVLGEGELPADPIDHVTTSCTAFCSSKGKKCEKETMDFMVGMEGYTTIVGQRISCKTPLFETCNSAAPGISADGFCFYYGSTCAKRSGNTACDATVPNGLLTERICQCGLPPKKIVNASSKNGISLLFTLFALFFFFGKASRNVAIVVCLIMFVGTNFVDAHNWIQSAARALGRASTTRPCLPRSDDKPQVQVTINQAFEVEWAQGHPGRHTYFVLQTKANENQMYLNRESVLDRYFLNATQYGSSLMDVVNDKQNKRYHRTGNMPNVNSTWADRAAAGNTTDPSWVQFERLIGIFNATGDYLLTADAWPRSDIFRGGRAGLRYLYEYQSKNLGTDAMACYNNPNLPHIICAWRFQHTFNYPVAYDTARFRIPTGQPLNTDYTLQWIWGGYYDCIDINVPGAAGNVAERYGVRQGPDEFIKEEHCQYTDPVAIRRVHETFGTGRPCIDACRGMNIAQCGGVNIFTNRPASTVHKNFINRWQVDWNTTLTTPMWKAFETYPRDILVCAALEPKEPGETFGAYEITNDPSDPIFYGTCYRRRLNIDFIGFTNAINTNTADYQFLDQCISCDEQKANERALTNGFANYAVSNKNCRMCDKDAPTLNPSYKGKYEVAASLVRNNTFCDGYGTFNTSNFRVANHTSCAAGFLCHKQLRTYGTQYNLILDECAALVKRDPQCSGEGFFQLNSQNCFCYKKDACCKTCSPVGAQNNWRTFRVNEVADPTCANGNVEGTICCPKSCIGGCSSTSTGNSGQVGFCHNLDLAVRPCSQTSAPCSL